MTVQDSWDFVVESVLQVPSMKMPRLQSYTVDFKLDAIRFLDEHQGNVALTAKEFGVDRKRI